VKILLAGKANVDAASRLGKELGEMGKGFGEGGFWEGIQRQPRVFG
jgi:hypothetical protein